MLYGNADKDILKKDRVVDQAVAKAYQFCKQLTKSHYENFPVASFLVPKHLRPAVYSLYAFSRIADDFADEDYPARNQFNSLEQWRAAITQAESSRLEKLSQWRQALQNCLENPVSENPVFTALAHTLKKFQFSASLLFDLLKAFEQDVVKRRYKNFGELIEYSQYSANPIGRVMLQLFNYREENLFQMSDALCTGLQLVNFWQDIAIDREKDRIYIPQNLLERFNISETTLFENSSQVDWQPLLRELGQQTLPFFTRSLKLSEMLKGRLKLELRWTILGGLSILKQACFYPHRIQINRPALSRRQKLQILLRGLIGYCSYAQHFIKQ